MRKFLKAKGKREKAEGKREKAEVNQDLGLFFLD